MGRYLTFIFGGLLLFGSGCHKATGPIDQVNQQKDTLPTALGLHYPSMNVKFSNIIKTGHHYSFSNNTLDYNYDDTTLSALSSYFLTVNSSSTIIKEKNLIPKIDGDFKDFGPSTGTHSVGFSDLSFSYKADSSIYILLTGIDASKHHPGIRDYFYEHHYPTHSGDIPEYIREDEDYFYKCTDSTRIEITVNYVK